MVPARDGDHVLRDLFEPLGYAVEIDRPLLNAGFPEWEDAPNVTLGLRGVVRVRDLLAHLTVLIPVLDDAKHYFVGEDETDKLLRRGEGWLQAHPLRETITKRYLRHRRTLVDDAVARLTELDDRPAESEPAEASLPVVRLHDQRLAAAVDVLRESGARRVLDLGCGEGRLLQLLREIPQFTEIVGVDVSHQALARAARALDVDDSGPKPHDRIKLLHGALTYRDPRLAGYDAAAAIEVIEHLDPWRIAAFSRVVFGEARPGMVVVTTPNADYNVRFPDLDAGALRHSDHRFEWTRAEFRAWCESVCAAWGYQVRIHPIGPLDEEAGAPLQMAVFSRHGGEGAA